MIPPRLAPTAAPATLPGGAPARHLRCLLPGGDAGAGSARLVARRFEAAVLFIDVVDFSSLAARLEPELLVGFLGELFARLERLARRRGVQPVKSVGDAWLAVALGTGPADRRAASAAAGLALDAVALAGRLARPDGRPLALRAGLHVGPLVAGLVGPERKPCDLWGETVNVAHRLESLGAPGRVQASAAAAALLSGVALVPRGPVPLKGGGGEVEAFWVEAGPP